MKMGNKELISSDAAISAKLQSTTHENHRPTDRREEKKRSERIHPQNTSFTTIGSKPQCDPNFQESRFDILRVLHDACTRKPSFVHQNTTARSNPLLFDNLHLLPVLSLPPCLRSTNLRPQRAAFKIAVLLCPDAGHERGTTALP